VIQYPTLPDLDLDEDPPKPVQKPDFPMWEYVQSLKASLKQRMECLPQEKRARKAATTWNACFAKAESSDRKIASAIRTAVGTDTGALEAIESMIEQAVAFYGAMEVKLDLIEARPSG
jgi:hypothetical protein